MVGRNGVVLMVVGLWVSACDAGPVVENRQFVFSEDAAKGTAVAPGDAYSAARGYGFDLATRPGRNQPFFFSVSAGEGTYRVVITLGASGAAGDTTVRAESRQLVVESVRTAPGEFVRRTIFVNVRNSRLAPPPRNAPGGAAVQLNERETGLLRWDDKLTLEFDGPAPALAAVEIEPAKVPVIYLAGDSTVTDQPAEPGASWGQMLPRFVSGVAVANHAESGETMKSFLSELRLAKILSQIGPGDFLFVQFGHNDEKANWPQTYADAKTVFPAYLRVFIAEARARGATPVLVTPMQRRLFGPDGQVRNSHGDYPQAVRDVAHAEQVPVIDLEHLSRIWLDALGPQRSALAFPPGGRDVTHTNDYGGYELAKCVAREIKAIGLPIDVSPEAISFDPGHPDAPEMFSLPPSAQHSDLAPRGN